MLYVLDELRDAWQIKILEVEDIADDFKQDVQKALENR